jgi:hypothetical protein
MTTALLALASPATATTWSDIGCGIGLISEGHIFQSIKGDGTKVKCELKSADTLTCADGATHKIVVLPNNEIMLDGVRLYVVTNADDSIVCD